MGPMSGSHLLGLQAVLHATDPLDQREAWAVFVREHSELLLRVARRMGGGHDAAMDRYAFVLESLQQDDFRRLRCYFADGERKFSTWLTVVVRRLCLDHHRHRYGRPQGETAASAQRRAERRNLVDLVSDELSLGALSAPGSDDPDLEIRRNEVSRALECALACLPASERLILRLRFEDDLSVPEIARATSAGSPFRLYRRIDRLLRDLKAALEESGIDDASP